MNLLVLARDVKNLKSGFETVQQSRAPGVLTNRTTRGVTRKPLSTVSSNAPSTSDKAPRWA